MRKIIVIMTVLQYSTQCEQTKKIFIMEKEY